MSNLQADNEKNEKINSVKIHEKPKWRRLRVGDPDFVPPDGGWGWLIVFACGFSNLSVFPMFQEFGLVFRAKFEELGINSSQTTTVINMNLAFNACVGLFNGPVFRKFTYRQVAMFGSLLVSSSLFLSRFCEGFWTYLFFYSACYGAGLGLIESSNDLALNTYFRARRRIAMGLSWTMTAMGPIMWPYVTVALNGLYGMEGTLLLFAGFALHAFVCSLLLQPVNWHTQFKYRRSVKAYGCRLTITIVPFLLITLKLAGDKSAPIEKKRKNSLTEPIQEGVELKAVEDGRQTKNGIGIKLPDEKEHDREPLKQESDEYTDAKNDTANEYGKLSLWRKLSIVFDFELFRDRIYVNLMLGITIANFAEINFSILTPMVLKEFNFTQLETATFMSLLGAIDIVVRFFVPFLADKIGWTNKTFFIVGVMAMAMGRIILVHTQTYKTSLIVAVIIGAGKGLRTIFIALVIPSHVPLERLPAASGLQLATNGILFITLGPVVGWVREVVNNYVITLHLLNICTYFTAVAWTIQWMITRKHESEAITKTKVFKNSQADLSKI